MRFQVNKKDKYMKKIMTWFAAATLATFGLTAAADEVTSRLSFIVEGAGRVHVDGVDCRHVKADTDPVADYSEIRPGAHELKGVPEENGAAAFYVWYSNTLSAAEVLADPSAGEWIAIGDRDTLTYVMPVADTVLKAVFLPAPIKTAVVRLEVASAAWMDFDNGSQSNKMLNFIAPVLDGDALTRVAGEASFTNTAPIKVGSYHTLAVRSPDANWKFVWKVNGVQVAEGLMFNGLTVTGPETTVTLEISSAATIEWTGSRYVSVTWDSHSHMLGDHVSVTGWDDSTDDYEKWFRGSDSWGQDPNQVYFSDVGKHYISWRVTDAAGFIHAEEVDEAAPCLEIEYLYDDIPAVTIVNSPVTYDGKAQTPAIMVGGEVFNDSIYTWSFSDSSEAIDAGDYTVVVAWKDTNKKPGAGTGTATFTINRAPILCTVEFDEDPPFADDAIPEVKVYDGYRPGTLLEEGEDYSLGTPFSKPGVYGKKFITVTGLSTGNFFGDKEVSYDCYSGYTDSHGNSYVVDVSRMPDNPIPLILRSVAADPTRTEYTVRYGFEDDGTNFCIVGVAAGAFTNAPNLQTLTIMSLNTTLFGNVIWGLDRIDTMNLPEDSPYRFIKYPEEYENGAAWLLKTNGVGQAALLGTAAAGDLLSLSNAYLKAQDVTVTSLAATAFAGNRVLREIALNNDLAFIGPAESDPLKPGILGFGMDPDYTVFTCPEEPNDVIQDYFEAYREAGLSDFTWYEKDDGTWSTFNWSEAAALIVSPAPDCKTNGFYTFKAAVDAARDGETVIALEDADASDLVIDGKTVIIDATDHAITGLADATLRNEGDFGIIGGTFDAELTDKLVYPEKQGLADNDDGTWTVVDISEIAAVLPGTPTKYYRTLEEALEKSTAVALIAHGEGVPATLYLTLAEAFADAKAYETITLIRGPVDERVVVDDVASNTVDLAGFAWKRSDTSAPAVIVVKSADAELAITNGYLNGRVRVVAGELTLDGVTARKNFEFDAEAPGRLIVEGGDYSLAAKGEITGLTVRGGTFCHDYKKLGCFDDQGGTKEFAQIARKLWTVVDASAVVATNAVSGQVHTNVNEAAECASDGDVIEIVAPVAETVVLSDAAIANNVKFNDPNGYLQGDPKFVAQRHPEFYTVKENDDGTLSFVHKDLPTHRLTFVIEGKGRAWFKNASGQWQDSRHVKSGTDEILDYTEFAPGAVMLKGMPEADAGDVFWRWEDSAGNRLYGEDYAIDPYADEIAFCMPAEDVTIRLVFKPADEVTTSATVTIVPAPWPNCASETKFDGKSGSVFANVKNGDHTVAATPIDENWYVAAWTTNGVVGCYATIYDDLMVGEEDIEVAPIFVPTAFGATSEDVEITYDGQPAAITVDVAGLNEGEYRIEYSQDGANWSAENPQFTDVCDDETVNWRVIYLSCGGAAVPGEPVIAIGANTVTILKKNLHDADVSFALDRYHFVADGTAHEPMVLATYNGMTLVEDTDFRVEYLNNVNFGTAHAYVYGLGNYYTPYDEIEDEDIPVKIKFNICQQEEIPAGSGVFYDIQKAKNGDNFVAVLDHADGQDGVFAVPGSVESNATGTKRAHKITAILNGAFQNSPDITELNLKALDDDLLDIRGNIIMGLANLERIDFPGEKPEDSPYYYSRLGEEFNGAGVLVKNLGAGAPYDWENDLRVELLGVEGAGDEFVVEDVVVKIAQTAFDGNPVLKNIVLHNGIEAIEPGFTANLDLKKTVFTMAEEPSEAIKEMFLNEGEDGIKWFESPDGTFWTTSPWTDAEAKIVTPFGEETYYLTLQEAIDDARDGETVTVIKNLDGGAHSVVIPAGKKVLIDAFGETLSNMSINPASTDSLGITAGTFDFDYEHPVNYLVASERFTDPVMSKWYDADADAWRWTVINRPTAVCTVTHEGATYYCASLADANRSAEAGDTVTVVAAKLEEDVVFDKSLNFVFAKETTWNGQLTASGAGTIVTVSGFRAKTPGIRTFAVANGAASVDFGYSPAQHAVADSSKYAIFRTGEARWRLLASRLQVAKDTDDDDELFTNMNLAVKLAESGRITVTADGCDQDIDAANDFEIVTAVDVVYNGTITANGNKVTTALGSVFGQNLIDEFDWSNGLTLEAQDTNPVTYKVVEAEVIVARFVFDDGRSTVNFSDPAKAVAAVDTFKPIAEFQIGVNDSSCTYDFQGGEKKDGANATFAKLVSVGTGENTIENAVLRGKFAVSGDTGTVVFGKGVRMTNPNTEFREGDVTLIVKKGSYVNDPSEFCVEGTLGARRKGHVTDREDLDGMYVIYPEAEIAVAVGDVHYHTLQDAFDLATGGTIVLFNNLTNDSVAVSRTATLTGKSFTLTRKSATVNTIRRTNAATLIEVGANAELKLENIVFDGANVDSTKPMIAVKATGGLVIGDKLEMKGAKGGAVNVANNGQIKINGSASQIWDNNGTNVVLANQQTGLVLVKDDDGDAAGGYNPCRIGIWCANYKAGQQFGTVDPSFPYPMFCDGDISVETPDVYFTNDRDATLHHGKGATIVGPADNAISGVRWVGGFKEVLKEGNFLISRTGNELVWLARQTKPGQDPDDSYVGSTKGTITLKVAKGNDYALVTEGIAFTNWMSATGTYLTFDHLTDSTTYTLLKRKSITTSQMVSDFIVNRADIIYRSEKYNAKEIAQLFDSSDITRFENKDTKREVAENAAVIVTVAADGRGYVVTLKKDLHHGVDLWDDLGPVKIDLAGSYIDARTGGDEGIRIKAAADYDEVFPTELDIVNSSGLGRIAKIVGATGADGDATDADGKDGAAGIRNASGNMTYVTVNGGVEVYGGNGGNGANRVNDEAGVGGNGGDAIKGVISLTLNGGTLHGGVGGNGGESTNGEGGNGGNGGAGIGDNVTGEVLTGGIYGGNGGNGGGSGKTAGVGGNGGDAISNLEGVVLDGDAFTGEIEVIAGKGGTSTDPDKAGQDGKGGKPEAPAAPTVKYVTGESVTLNVEPGCEYLVFKTADGAPSIEKQAWIKTGPQETALFVDSDTLKRKLVKDTSYTVWARTPAGDGNLVSYYSEMTFTTLGHDASDLVAFFKGKATAAEKDGVYVVTLTDDINEGLEIPDNLGIFKLDMQGWSITGRNGNAAVGELDGEAAITFTAARDSWTKLTQIIIVGNGDNTIAGGNGDDAIDSLDDADGDNGGEGGNGFAVADNYVKAVVIDFENGTLVGGNGGDGADSVNGNGGEGGNGGDAYDDNRLVVTIGPDALAVGGDGGAGGNVYGGIAGNGGNGGNALQGEGGAWGAGGLASGAGGQDGQNGVGGDGVIPGGPAEKYHVKLERSNRFFATFEEAVEWAVDGDTLTVVRDCVFDGDDYGEVEVTANNLTVRTADGVTLTWNGTLRVASGVTGFAVAADCTCSDASEGTLIIDGEATIEGGVIRNLAISFEGKAEVRGGTLGTVAVARGGRLMVPVNTTSVIEKGIFSDKGGIADKDGVFLFGGLYGLDPSAYRRDPFIVKEPTDVDGVHYRIVQDPNAEAMVSLNGNFYSNSVDAAFAAIASAKTPITVWLLKDAEVHTVLTDQAATDATIYGNGYTIVDAREKAECEDALFNLQGNLTLKDVTFDGQGTQKGKFIEIMGSKRVTLDGCTVTGYACEALNGVDGKIQLISASSAGQGAELVLNDTTITGNDVSCAVSLTDRSGSAFEYQLLLSGATTITDNGGNGIVANKFGSIVMADDLTGGYIDVAYAGLADGKFALAADKYRDGADHFRSEATRECGSVIEEGGKAYVKWGVDERQYAAKVGNTLYETIEDALEEVQDGDTLTLMQDAEITRTVTVRLADSADRFTIDLNGKTLTNSANKLKFGTGTVTIRNGTLAKDDEKYALYLYGGAVELEDVTVDSDIYVARGWLVIGDADVGVKGVIAKTNAGSVSLSEGFYTENPAAYVVSGHSVAAGDYGVYAWKVVAATEVVGFADGFILDTTPDKDGNIALDLTTRDAFGVLRDGAKVILNGNVEDNVSVKAPAGWKVTVSYDPADDKTTVLFEMDKEFLKPVFGTDDPGDRPFEVVTVGGQVTQITLRVKNGVKGFWYQLMSADDLGQEFKVATEVQAMQDGNLAITLKTSKDKFFKLNVSDRPATK